MDAPFNIAFERIKSTDFPLQCRGMYYFAKGRHAHQNRKVSGLPYYVHPRGVAFIVMISGGSCDQINAAFAHDLLEDTETSFMEIATVANSLHVAEMCSELRNNDYTIKEVGKEEYMLAKVCAMKEDSMLVKLADMLYNISDNPNEDGIRRITTIAKALKDRQLPEPHKRIIDEILKYE